MSRAAATLAVAVAVAGVASSGTGCSHDPPRIAVGVAALLRHAMPELVDRYEASSGVHVDVSYGASTVIAEKVEGGAALDAVIVAEDDALAGLVAHARVDAATRRVVATTAIVLVGPAGSTATIAALGASADGAAPGTIAIGDPATVPAGRYAQAYLQHLGIWDAVRPRLVFGGDVAAVLALAQAHTTAFAIVYRTDAIDAAPLVMLDRPTDAPVVHVVGGVVSRSGASGRAAAFLAFVASPAGQAILARHGFGPASASAP